MHKVSVIILILISIIAITISIYFYKQVKYYYTELYKFKTDPLNLSSTDWKKDKCLPKLTMLGDSRIKSWNIGVIENFNIQNLGINGYTTEQLLIRLKIDSISFFNETIILQIGINDLKTIPVFQEQKINISTQTIKNIKEIAYLCLDKGASKVIITTIFPLGKISIFRKPFWSKDINSAIIEVNEKIQKLNINPKIEIFDSFTILQDNHLKNAWGKRIYYDDLLHLNSFGYTILNQQLLLFLKNSP